MFVLVRHGNTFEAGTSPRRIGARTDLPLTAAGIGQARALGTHFAHRGMVFAQALVSPLLRTRQTAAEILAQQALPPDPTDAQFLREIDHGPDENQTEDAVRKRLGAEALLAWDTCGQPPADWIVDPEARIAAWRALFAAPPAKGPILLVTSNGAARFALLADLGLREQAALHATLKLPTGGYGVIARRADSALHLACWGERP
ncbi:MAG: histidine phosphatase family protein [Alphaproteobacteria bacterium HGW-Alphaproteobacteria-14]|nr:MAG: histidine phosphatase family protein [Alphaproteobacteria bacterium HGW-Alphaproteobacteria-14]